MTPAETIVGWWRSYPKHPGIVLYGAAYAPAASSTDPVPIDREQNLVAALAPTVSGTSVQYVALTTPLPPPLQLVSGTVGALLLVANLL